MCGRDTLAAVRDMPMPFHDGVVYIRTPTSDAERAPRRYAKSHRSVDERVDDDGVKVGKAISASAAFSSDA